MDDGIKGCLERECREKEITFNKLVHQVLTRHVRWYSMADKMDMITMPKSTYKAYTSKISDDEIKEIAKTAGQETFKNYILLNTGEFRIKSLLETLDLWLTINHISFEHIIINNDGHQYVIQHSMGKKFSILLNETVSGLVEELDCKLTNMNMTEENLTFVIDKNSLYSINS